MRVALLPDPLLFEQPGGLRTQVCETMAALGRHGVQATVFAPGAPPPHGCDLVHLFGTGHGNAALLDRCAAGFPVVLSPRVSPAWSSVNGTRARVADRVLGNQANCDLDSGYAQIRRALRGAHLVVAASEAEQRALCRGFLVPPERVCVIGGGIGDRFFTARGQAFRERVRVAGPFALMVGQVSPWHGQLEMARMLAGLALPLVVIGKTHERDTAYRQALRASRTVICIDAVDYDDPVLASAYAAASMLVLAAHGTCMPMVALESLAAGTPVLARAALGSWGRLPGVCQVGADDPVALAWAVSELLSNPPPRDEIRNGVREFTWDHVAGQLIGQYRRLLDGAR